MFSTCRLYLDWLLRYIKSCLSNIWRPVLVLLQSLMYLRYRTTISWVVFWKLLLISYHQSFLCCVCLRASQFSCLFSEFFILQSDRKSLISLGNPMWVRWPLYPETVIGGRLGFVLQNKLSFCYVALSTLISVCGKVNTGFVNLALSTFT